MRYTRYMLKTLWKIVFIFLMILILSLLIHDSRGFDWQNFNYKKDKIALETIDIGFIGSLTGQGSLTGIQSLAAAQLAVDDLNALGGIHGKTIRLFSEDGGCTREGGNQAAQKLVDRGVYGIVGGLCSAESTGLIDVIDSYMIPTISYCSSATNLSGASDYFFRVYPSDIFQGVYAADYIKNSLDIQDVSIVYIDDAWGQSLREVFTDSFTEQGGTIASEYTLTDDPLSIENMWKDIMGDNVDLVYFLGFDEGTHFALSHLNGDEDFILFGADGWDNVDLWSRLDVPYMNVLYTVVDTSEYQLAFAEKMKARGIYNIASCVPQAYDAIKVLANAFSQNMDDPMNITPFLRDMNYTQGVSKRQINFDDKGDISQTRYVVKKVGE